MKRRLFTTAAFMSLLLSLAMVLLWVRSYWKWDEVALAHGTAFDSVSSLKGVIYIEYRRHDLVSYSKSTLTTGPFPVRDWTYYKEVRWTRWGFGGFYEAPSSSTSELRVIVPDWSIVLLLTALPAIRVAARIRRRARITRPSASTIPSHSPGPSARTPKIRFARVGGWSLIRRLPFDIASTASLVMFILVLSAWLRGYWANDVIQIVALQKSHWDIKIDASHGRVLCAITDSGENYQPELYEFEHITYPPKDLGYQPNPTNLSRTYWNRWGAIVTRPQSREEGESTLDVQFRLWPLALLSGLMPAAWLSTHRRRRPRMGHCPCGYNLTANTSGVCPECGSPIPSSPATPEPLIGRGLRS